MIIGLLPKRPMTRVVEDGQLRFRETVGDIAGDIRANLVETATEYLRRGIDLSESITHVPSSRAGFVHEHVLVRTSHQAVDLHVNVLNPVPYWARSLIESTDMLPVCPV